MNKKQIGFITIIIIVFILILLLATFILSDRKAKNKPEISETIVTTTQTETTTSTTAPETSITPLFIIGEWEGKLAVFQNTKSSAPLKIYDVYLSTLPAEEQQRIKKGISVNDEKTLQRLLEDYTS